MKTIFIKVHGFDTKRVFRVNINLISKYVSNDQKSCTDIFTESDRANPLLSVSETTDELDSLIESIISDNAPTYSLNPNKSNSTTKPKKKVTRG